MVAASAADMLVNGLYLDRPRPTLREWSVSADAMGRARMYDLPAGTALSVVGRAPGFADATLEGLRLRPGESRAIELTLTPGCQVHGLLLDSADKPIGGHPIWLLRADDPRPRLLRRFDRPERIAASDEQGRFVFEGVSAGTWWIGPRPPEVRAPGRRAGSREDVAPLAQALAIDRRDTRRELQLRVDCGLYIEGLVLDSNEQPAGYCGVTAMRLEDYGIDETTADDKGRFRVGPLPKAVWTLQSDLNLPPGETDSEEVEAEAGEQGVVLRLRRGVAIGGTVVDEQGDSPSVCEILVNHLDESDQNDQSRIARNGNFELTGLSPGTFRVIARTTDGRLGFTPPIEIAPGRSRLDLVVRLTAAARLQMRFTGSGDVGWFEVLAGDALITEGSVEPGFDREVLAPAGAVEIRLYAAAGVAPEIRQLTLRGGERVEIGWPGSR